MIGELGEFWAAALAVRRRLLAPDPAQPLLRNVLTPRARLGSAGALRREHLLTACIDNSDGLYPTLVQLAEVNRVAIRLDRDAFDFGDEVLGTAQKLGIDPLRLALGWGDWQLIGTCRPEQAAQIEQFAGVAGDGVHIVGEVVDGSGVRLREGTHEGPLMPLDSQRFMPDSWFSSGLDGYIEQLLNAPLRAPA